jgi:DNA recombination protein RmuC
MPIEPALLAAAKSDPNLYTQAWQHNVLLTSPSTLLFVLRMVGQLWRNAQQQQNVQQIITRGERLLDKFNGFNDELEKIGSQLGQAQKSWENAKAKFSGNGGLISQAQKLANLGIKPKKPLPPSQGQISNQTDESD